MEDDHEAIMGLKRWNSLTFLHKLDSGDRYCQKTQITLINMICEILLVFSEEDQRKNRKTDTDLTSLRIPIETIYPLMKELSPQYKIDVLRSLKSIFIRQTENKFLTQDFFLILLLDLYVDSSLNSGRSCIETRLNEELSKIITSYFFQIIKDSRKFSYSWITIMTKIIHLLKESTQKNIYSPKSWLPLQDSEFKEALKFSIPKVNQLLIKFLEELQIIIDSNSIKDDSKKYQFQVIRITLHQFMINLLPLKIEDISKITLETKFNRLCYHSILGKSELSKNNQLQSFMDFFQKIVMDQYFQVDLDFNNDEEMYVSFLDKLFLKKMDSIVFTSELLIQNISEDLDKYQNQKETPFSYSAFLTMAQLHLLGSDIKLIEVELEGSNSGNLEDKEQKIMEIFEQRLKFLGRYFKILVVVLEFILCNRQKRSEQIYRRNMMFNIFYILNFLFEEQCIVQNPTVKQMLGDSISSLISFLFFFAGYMHHKNVRIELSLNMAKQTFESKISIAIHHFLLIELTPDKNSMLFDANKFDELLVSPH